MGKIKILPNEVINKIAAGEIVERPSSIVKELVENSIDAKSSLISIYFEKGGKKKILVKDNGIGMEKNDAIMAFEHHATSKIEKIEDIEKISTLGFRGEALPSIASVSKIILKTISKDEKEKGNFSGTEIKINGGKIFDINEISWAEGTEIEVSDLFFNLPVRKKFLKSDSVESSHIIRVVNHMALSHPEIGFKLKSGSRTILDIPKVKNLNQRISQIFKEEDIKNSKEISFKNERIEIHGRVSLPHYYKYNSSFQYFFINGRMVRDRTISSTLFKIYKNFLPSGTYPFAVIFIKIPEEEIDINVHPAKLEVRFKNGPWFSKILRETIEKALETNKERNFFSIPDENYFLREGEPSSNRGENFFENKFNFKTTLKDVKKDEISNIKVERSFKIEEENEEWIILGQFKDTFIIATSQEEIIIVDQHVAHEKILYEKFLKEMREKNIKRKKVLIPITLKISEKEENILKNASNILNQCGFLTHIFGKDEIILREIPYMASPEVAEEVAKEIISNYIEEGEVYMENFEKKIAATLACKSAIKANEKLTFEKMKYIINALFELDNPTHCPHGRPIILTIKEKDILKFFHRI